MSATMLIPLSNYSVPRDVAENLEQLGGGNLSAEIREAMRRLDELQGRGRQDGSDSPPDSNQGLRPLGANSTD